MAIHHSLFTRSKGKENMKKLKPVPFKIVVRKYKQGMGVEQLGEQFRGGRATPVATQIRDHFRKNGIKYKPFQKINPYTLKLQKTARTAQKKAA
jgi:phosphoribosylaminoimidazole-succinocarboxamide synthase